MKRTMLMIMCLVLFVVILTPGVKADERDKIKFIHIDKKQGLTSPYISSLYQDKEGFIWIGSYHSAVYRYDGKNVKAYRNDPSDPSSMPATKYGQMHLDDSGVLWIATLNGLVALDLNTDKVTHYTHDPGNPHTIPPGEITAIYEDSIGQLWLGTSEKGLALFNKQTGKVQRYSHDEENSNSLSSDKIFSLAKDSSGTLWIGTAAGANTFNKATGIFTRYQHDPDDSGTLSHNEVLSITLDCEGILWLATSNGLNAFEPGQDDFRHYFFDNHAKETIMSPTLVYAGPVSGRLWTPVYGAGLYEFDRETEEFILIARSDSDDPDSLETDSITTILEDRSGMLWIGGAGGFLNGAKLNREGFYYLKNDPGNPWGFHGMLVKAFAEDESGLIWVASLEGGLQVFDRESGKIIKRYIHDDNDPESILSNNAFTVLLDNTGVIWAGLREGMSRLDRKSGKFVHYPAPGIGTTALLQDSRGDIWTAGWTGLGRYNKKEDRFVPFIHDPDDPESIKPASLFDLYEDRDGNIIAGTYGAGIIHYNLETGKFTYTVHDPRDPGSLCSNEVFALLIDSRGEFWAATSDGLDRYDKENRKFIHYTHHDGLNSNTIYELEEDNHGNIWIITTAGLTKYDPVTDTFHCYDSSDGILGGDLYGKPFKSSDGFIYFSGEGINYFNPDTITDNLYIPPVVITRMKILNKDVPIGEFEKGRTILTKPLSQTRELELLYSDHIVFFEFSALSFVDSHKNQFAYIMEGLEEEWNYSGTRNFVTYTNLKPGKYTFRVKASNNDDTWNEAGVSLNINVLSPSWQTWWFKTGISILFVFLLAAIFKYAFIKIKTKQKAQMIQREVDIARNIQTSLLPNLNQFTDTGYDFEATINVEASVGGDYYDVIRGKDGRLWMGIGDVTGHGISAGLIMVMAQVGIHNLLETIPGITPEELLTKVNKIMTYNIRRKMKSDQHMTINFLVETSPGHFRYAGAHEVILIHRAKTGEIIQLETNGFWLGIIDDCKKQMSSGSGEFYLEKNDTLMLYTDGLIQIMNKDHEQFDITRLINIMHDNCDNPGALKMAIDKAIREFGGIQKDDIAYLICRRK
ncbi:MAG: SpoIIE family protein phosphatase [Spirochaetales bacterium]|nr:SpoIIE family protein phosphatase [Spirochaetales bacterium]